jgi:hypothetical protein
MKKGKIKNKYFTNNDEYFYFLQRDNIKILNVIYTHNFKIKVTYVIIK